MRASDDGTYHNPQRPRRAGYPDGLPDEKKDARNTGGSQNVPAQCGYWDEEDDTSMHRRTACAVCMHVESRE
eukprot:5349496-Prymnesium_polylepis.1